MSPASLLIPALVVAARGVVLRQSEKVAKHGVDHKGNRTSGVAAWDEGGLVRALEFKHRLRVCNAYPSAEPLHVFLSKEVELTSEAPMPYKACRDFKSPLKASDILDFRLGEALSSGTFSVTDLPNNDAVLLLVVHRHDVVSSAIAFESHVFGDNANAQAAIIDTYKGSAKSTPRIKDAAQSDAVHLQAVNKTSIATHTEDLRYNSVVAINPGIYEVELDAPTGLPVSRNKLVALNHESYVILRIGVEAKKGSSYPQEIVIYPSSSQSLLHSRAATASQGFVAVAAVLMAMFLA